MPKVKQTLITTAIEEFWPSAGPVVFLGESCRRFSRQVVWEALDGEVAPDPWENPNEVAAATQYVNVLYDRLLPLLSRFLNDLHSTQYSVRYWTIVLGPWLHGYLNVLYDRYRRVVAARRNYPDLQSIGIDSTSFVVPKDTREFIELTQDDAYNLQLYTRLFHYVGIPFIKRAYTICNHKARPQTARNLKERLRRLAKSLLRPPSRIACRNAQVLIDTAYFPGAAQLKLAIASRGKIMHLPNLDQLAHGTPSRIERSLLRVSIEATDDFQACVLGCLLEDMPLSFVEDFHKIRRSAQDSYPPPPFLIVSANSWYTKECFKHWAAAAADEGTLLAGVQHGGNYGSVDPMPSEDHETSITDVYYSWGWSRLSCKAEVKPMPPPKLTGRSLLASRERSGILYVMTSAPRFCTLPSMPRIFEEYLEWQIRFLEACPKRLRQSMKIRMHFEDFGWDMKARLEARVPGLQYGGWDTPFWADLGRAILFVCDHLSTTFVEALHANVPSVLFWDPKANPLRKAAIPYYEGLRSAGILHDSPESAAASIDNTVDAEQWWQSPKVQQARATFAGRFAMLKEDDLGVWNGELLLRAKSSAKAAQVKEQ